MSKTDDTLMFMNESALRIKISDRRKIDDQVISMSHNQLEQHLEELELNSDLDENSDPKLLYTKYAV